MSPGVPVEAAGCCSPSTSTALLCTPGCDPVTLVVRAGCVECGAAPGVPEVVGWLDAAGVFTAGSAPAGLVPCDTCAPRSCGTVTTVKLCDLDADGCVRFLRHLVVDCNGQVTATADTTLFGDPYTPVNPGQCDECPCEPETKVLPLCDHLDDGAIVRFLRRVTYDCETGQILTQEDLQLDGITPYTPTGRVDNCPCGDGGGELCEPAPVCSRFAGVSGPDVWELPEGAESFSVSIICGHGIEIRDCAGEVTVVDEGCGVLHYAAPQPGTGCAPRTLCTPFTVALPEGAAAYFQWITTCDGEESA